jgi:hypothetical protein
MIRVVVLVVPVHDDQYGPVRSGTGIRMSS